MSETLLTLEAINNIDTIFEVLFYVFFSIIFYVSIKQCFWNGDKSKVKLFFRTLFTNPVFCYIETIFVADALMAFVGYLSDSEYLMHLALMQDMESVSMVFALNAVCYLLALFFFAWRMGKWLGAKSREMVVFVYLMYSVFILLSIRGISDETYSRHPVFGIILTLGGTISLYIALWLFYRLVVKPLSKLIGSPYQTKKRMFVIPSALFSLFYGGVVMILVLYLDPQAIAVMYVFSTLVLYLFTWAFYVIIKNINATGEAIKARDEVKTLSIEVMEALAHTIDAKDEYTKGHSVRVAKYSRMLAERMGLPPEDCENIYYMGLLHDIGKIGVPNSIINSTSKLTDEEYAIIKTHPGLGFDILAEIKSRPDLSIGARWHHERYDGKGYPDRKAGEDIPFLARIIAVADSYDAMASNRSYRKFLPQEVIRQEIEKNSGTQFDPVVARYMIEVIDEDVNYELHEDEVETTLEI